MTGPKCSVFRFSDVEVHERELQLKRAGEALPVEPKAFRVLVHLLRNPGRLIPKDELLNAGWGDTAVTDNSLTRNIALLRRLLGDDTHAPRYIETVSTVGYRFICPVEASEDPTVRPEAAVAAGTTGEGSVMTVIRSRAVGWVASLVLLTLLVAAGWYYRSTVRSRGTIDSVAVLPFENASGDPNAEYLSDGIAESLINSLSQLPDLKVMSRDSSFHYRGKETDAHAVGQALGVRSVFKGTVARQGDTLTITAELIDARDNSHLWGQQYSRKPSDIFVLQEEIAREITAALRVRLTREDEKRLGKIYTASAEAYEKYLMGRYWWNKQTDEGFRKGIDYFEQAIAKDPAYALARAGLADCYISQASFGLVSANEGYSKGREWAEKALKLDDTLAAPHVSLASVKTDYDWNWAEGEKEARRAIELNPGDAKARLALAEVLWTTGRLGESIQETKRALELDPLSINYNTALDFEFLMARRYDEAIEQGARLLELDPRYILAYYFRGVAYVKKSSYMEALAEFEKGISISPDDPVALTGLGYGYAVMGRRADAERVLARLNELSKREFISPVWMAKIYSGLGEKDKAFESLERAYEDRSIVSVAFIKTNPMLDPLRTDQRFAELLRRLNLQN